MFLPRRNAATAGHHTRSAPETHGAGLIRRAVEGHSRHLADCLPLKWNESVDMPLSRWRGFGTSLGCAGGAQRTSEDPCRFATAEAVGKAFGRPMQSSKLVDVCQYRGTPTGLVVVRVKPGLEGTILRHVKGAAAQGQRGRRK